VLTASGALVAIRKLHTGQKVLASGTKTGKDRAEPVAVVLVHHDTDLYDLKVRAGHRTAVIATTSNHLFWDASLNKWVPAAKLRKGEALKTPSGQRAVAWGGKVPANPDGWMWDLTISRDHDFYIQAATTAIHVHNCSPAPGDGGALAGSGPARGILEVSSRVKSTAAFENFNPAVPRDFVFDPASERLLVGGSNLPKVFGHSGLVGVGGFDEGTVVGGQLSRVPGGEFLTNEWSGHFGGNWTDAVRQQFMDFMSGFGFDTNHTPWGAG
jgi:hypothetical protein